MVSLEGEVKALIDEVREASNYSMLGSAKERLNWPIRR